MSVPLGRAVGNALEVAESVEVLRGGGPADVVALTVALAREMLTLAGVSDVDPAEVLASGAAYRGVGADDRRAGRRPGGRAADRGARRAGARRPVRGADRLRRAGGRGGGVAAGRRPGPPVRRACRRPPGCGCWSSPGDPVAAGQPLLELHTDTPDAVPGARAALDGELVVADEPTPRPALVLGTLRP